LNNKWVLEEIDKIRDQIHSLYGYRRIDDEVLYTQTRHYAWGELNKRSYIHFYYNEPKRAEDMERFHTRLIDCYQELTTGNLVTTHQSDYDKFFTIKTTPKHGTKVSYNIHVIKQYEKKYVGFQVYLSNKIKESLEALQIYRDKDVVEKGFDDFKNALDIKRLRMHSIEAVDGRLFVQFIALIYTSALRNELRKSKLIEKYTVQELLDEMKTITRITYPKKNQYVLTEISKTQRELLKTFNIPMPT